MSSAADGGAKPFFCYKCDRRVTVSDATDPFCPICLQGFLEECYNPSNPNPNSTFPLNLDPFAEPPFAFDPFSLLPVLLSSASTTTTTLDLRNPPFFSNSPESDSGSSTRPDSSDPDTFDPFMYLQNHLRGLHADGANVQFEINHPSEPGFRLPANIGDYFLGPGLEQLIQQLVENDPNRYGTPPASKSAVENLPTVTVDDELLNSELNQCAVCQDEFEKGSGVKQMPCKHVYHDGCLLPWLQLHSSCPVCRYELPTDDPDYENHSQAEQGNGGEGSRSGGNGGGEGNRPGQRTFRISLRYPFGSGGSAQENSQRGWGRMQEDLD